MNKTMDDDGSVPDGARTPVATIIHDPLNTQLKMSFQIICEEVPEGQDAISDIKFKVSNHGGISQSKIQI